MSVKKMLKNSKYTSELYIKLRNKYDMKNNMNSKYIFYNKAKGSDKVCIVLAGYKKFLIPAVMGRLYRYAPKDMDICIVTSGMYVKEIDELCKKNNWSYLSTKRNNVSLAQNIAISLFPQAEYIFKLDEDIFITKDYFEKMVKAYQHASDCTLYEPGVIAPILPINGFGHIKILEKFNLLDIYEKEFEKPKYFAGPHRKIENDEEVAKFMWGNPIRLQDGNVYKLPSIDQMNRIFEEDELNESVCPIRFSIGAILFKRKLWEEMRYFKVGKGVEMGRDEEQLCKYCCIMSRPIMISENIVVGHLSFGNQNEAMKRYYMDNKEIFMAQEE